MRNSTFECRRRRRFSPLSPSLLQVRCEKKKNQEYPLLPRIMSDSSLLHRFITSLHPLLHLVRPFHLICVLHMPTFVSPFSPLNLSLSLCALPMCDMGPDKITQQESDWLPSTRRERRKEVPAQRQLLSATRERYFCNFVLLVLKSAELIGTDRNHPLTRPFLVLCFPSSLFLSLVLPFLTLCITCVWHSTLCSPRLLVLCTSSHQISSLFRAHFFLPNFFTSLSLFSTPSPPHTHFSLAFTFTFHSPLSASSAFISSKPH